MEDSAISRRICIRNLDNLNLPQNVIEILHSSCSTSTWSRDCSYVDRYKSFCSTSGFDPSRACVRSVLCFLSKLYEDGLSYSSVNTARSALSVMYGKVDNVSIGEHPLVKRFMAGIAKLRPPTPKYTTTWDVEQVFNVFKNWKPNNELNLYELSVKLSSLLALVSGHRVQTLHAINIDNIVVEDKQVRIFVSKLLKTSGPKSSQPCIHLPLYHKVKKLCVASCLKEYLSRTKNLRKDTKQLFVTTRERYRAVSKQTISHWLVKSLSLANINTTMYGSHSFRHASTSKAFSLGVKVSTIFDNAGWSKNSNVFYRFYNKNIVKDSPTNLEFCNKVLNCSK